MTLEELEVFCREYDDKHGFYPEHRFEGLSLFDFIKAKVTGAKQKPRDKWSRHE